jgi:hypothetical protein
VLIVIYFISALVLIQFCAECLSGNAKASCGFAFITAAGIQGTKEEISGEFRRIRDEIKEKLTAFFQAEKIIN